MVFIDYYKTLEIDVVASSDSIKAAHRAMSKRFHPDVNAKDDFYEDRFKDVQEAYKVLSNPETRRLYDRVHHRYSKSGISTGNVIHIADDDARHKPAYAWHPDYKQAPARSLMGKRSSLLLGLTIILVIGTCAILFWEKEPGRQNFVADADVFKIAPAATPAVRAVKARTARRIITRADVSRPVVSLSAANLDQPVVARQAGSSIPGKKIPPVPIARITSVQRVVPMPQQPVAADIRSISAADLLKMFDPVSPPIPMGAPLGSAVSRIDTDLSDLMVRRVTQVQYGYLTYLVRRSYHFRSGKPDEYATMHYVSGVKLYKPEDLKNRQALLSRGAMDCRRREEHLAFMNGDFTMTYAITAQNMKIFATEAEAHASLLKEGRVTPL